MYTSLKTYQLSNSWLFRYGGRAGGLAIVASWLVLVVVDAIRHRPPILENYYQFIPVAVIFAGYAIGWRKEIIGGVLAIAGTLGFIAQFVAMFGVMPSSESLWFAAPGVFYLIAHYLDGRHVAEQEWRP